MAHRTFRDRQGHLWDAWDVHPTMAERRATAQPVPAERRLHREVRTALARELRGGWLAFESKTERRRLTPPPDGWQEMSEAELEELLARALSTGTVRRLIE